MIRLSAFADEISPDLHEQIAVLQQEGIHFIDLRSVESINVLDLSDQQVTTIKQTLKDHDIQVAAIGSPIGKVPVDAPFAEHLERFKRAIAVAQAFETQYIRLFSFYPPASSGAVSQDLLYYREEILQRLLGMAELAQAANLILLHENEKDIYGDSIQSNLDLLRSIDNPAWRAAFDPANYLQCQEHPYPEAYSALRPWLEYIHVKDVAADGTLVPAGQGEAHWSDLLQALRADGYDGFLSLEPHLQAAGQFQGFSGPALFHTASQALQQLLKAMNWSYA